MVPVTFLILVLMAIGDPWAGFVGSIVAIVAVFAMLYWVCALPAGIVLLIWGAIENGRDYREAQQYSELHGWHPISKTAWRNRKRGDVELAVMKAFRKPTYILTIVADGETTTIDEFGTAGWALQFGDWLWQELLQTGAKMDLDVVSEKRNEWERSMAVYSGPR